MNDYEQNPFAHCRDGHKVIGYVKSEHERCPICKLLAVLPDPTSLREIARVVCDEDALYLEETAATIERATVNL